MTSKPHESIATDPKRRFLCRHIFTDGHRCGSPALRGESLCYYHIRTRRQGNSAGRSGTFVLPHADDRASIQLAIADVLCRIAAGDIDLKRGTALLYGLQVASTNLGRQPAAQTQPQPQVDDFTEDYHLGDLAPIAEIPSEKPESAQPQIATNLPLAKCGDHLEISDRPDLGVPLAGSSALQPAVPGASSDGDFNPTSSATTSEEEAELPTQEDLVVTNGTQNHPDDHPELAPAEPSIHLPRPTLNELLRRREKAFVHNATEKDFRLYPAIREELIFTPTPEELAEARSQSEAQPDPELELAI